MKVIKQGHCSKKDAPWSKVVECTDGCGATLLVEEKDLYLTYNDYAAYETYRCCECGHQSTIDVPSNIVVSGGETLLTTFYWTLIDFKNTQLIS